MQPILVIALIGVAAAATSVGFLNTNIMLNVQNFGVGMETLETPISDANIDFSIGRLVMQDPAGKTIFMNIIDACSFHYPANSAFPGLTSTTSKVICKLTDENGNVVAEGMRVGMINPSQTVQIAIDTLAYDGANKVKNIHDVTVVALGEDPTFFEADPIPPQEAAPRPPNEAPTSAETLPGEVVTVAETTLEIGPFPETDPFTEVEIFSETILPEIGDAVFESDPFSEVEIIPEIGGNIETIPFSEVELFGEVGTTFETDPFSEVDLNVFGEIGPIIFESNIFSEVVLLESDPIIVESAAIPESPPIFETFLVPETVFPESFLVPESIVGESAP